MGKLLASLSLVALMVGSSPSTARDLGQVSPVDASVRYYNYSRDEVYELVGTFGVTTQIWIGADEEITSVQSGDGEAWDVSVPAGRDYIAVKPIVTPSKPTNLAVYTSKRVYQFALSADETTDIRKATFTARFKYPSTVDSLDALNATVKLNRTLEGQLQDERAAREALSEQYSSLQTGYNTQERELELQRQEEARTARLSELTERLAYEERSRNELSQETIALRNELDSIRSTKDRQVFEVLEGRLKSAEEGRTAADQRAIDLQTRLAAIDNDRQARDEARIVRELAEARENKVELRAAMQRLNAMEEERKRAAAASRSTVVFDAFADESNAGSVSTSPSESSAFFDRRVASRSDDRVFLDDAAGRGIDNAEAVQLTSLDSKVIQGALLSGTLETAINTELSGMVRAILSEPVWAADGSRILADRGSRLIGEYRSVVQFGSDRVLVAWNRMITTDGVSVELGSPGVDGLGRAGLGGISDTHFATRFGAAALISILGGGSAFLVSEATDQFTSDAAQGVADDTQNGVGRVLNPYLTIPTTVHVDQGTPINVFVARDLDFSKVR